MKDQEKWFWKCTTAVGTDDHKFQNPDTGGNYHPYKDYAKIYPQWTITEDLSLEASMYWFIGHYASEIADAFAMKKALVPYEWRKLKWSDVKKNLKDSFNL